MTISRLFSTYEIGIKWMEKRLIKSINYTERSYLRKIIISLIKITLIDSNGEKKNVATLMVQFLLSKIVKITSCVVNTAKGRSHFVG